MVAIIIVVCIIVYNHLPSTKLRKQPGLGNKYLAELNYEQAIAAFTKAIGVDPDNEEVKELLVTTYLAWAVDLNGQGNADRAMDVLKEGYNLLADARLRDVIYEMTQITDHEKEQADEGETD